MRTTENITHLTIEFKDKFDRHKFDFYEGAGNGILVNSAKVKGCVHWEEGNRLFITYPNTKGSLHTVEEWKNGAYKEYSSKKVSTEHKSKTVIDGNKIYPKEGYQGD